MALTHEIKKAARISHDALDDEIERLEAWAQAELIRVGVPAALVEVEEDVLVRQAIITGVLTQLYSEQERRDEAKESFTYQLDCLRKHSWEKE